MEAFNGYMKDFLSVRFTKSQVYEKIRRLKKKFQTNDEKCKNGEELVFSRPHENKLFEISQKIWRSPNTEGNDGEAVSGMNKGIASMPLKSLFANKKDDIVAISSMPTIESTTKRELFVQEQVNDTITKSDKEETPDFWSLYQQLCACLESESYGYLTLRVGDTKEYVKKIIIRIGEEKAREMEDEWKAFYH